MAKDYSQETIAAMAAELHEAAQALGIALTAEAAPELVTALLDASARWSAETRTRASGPFGTFLAGAAGPDAEGRGLPFVDSLVSELSTRTGPIPEARLSSEAE